MSVKATAKGVRMSPRKVGVVAALVRGRTVEDALTILSHTPRRSAIPVRKVIESARANADHNHRLKPDTLKIVSISVTSGKSYKRARPVARGASHPYLLRSSHIFVEVDGDKRPDKKPEAKVATKTPVKKPAKQTQGKPAAKKEIK
ncbi:MAG: 50S ribosomal protein L22 [Candidatus Saccharimonadales bacterium]